MRTMNRWAGSFLVLICAMCAGCSIKHINLEPAVAEEINSLQVVSVISQVEPEIHVQQAQAGGAMFGLIGALIDAGVTSSRESEAQDIGFLLRAECKDLDFREVFWGEIESVLNASVWPAEFELERLTEPMSERELEREVGANSMDGFLVISTEYFLTPSVTVLVVRTKAELFRGSMTKRAYLGEFSYLSDEILLSEENVSKSQAAELWAENHASRFKAEISKGIVETIRMIQYDLIDRKYEEHVAAEEVSFSYEGLDGLAEEKTVTATLIAEVGGRAFFRGKKGNLFSMPDRWMVVLDREEF